MRRPGSVHRAAALLATVVAVVGLSGCFKVSHDVRVRSDGSGSVVLHVVVDKKAVDALARSVTVLGAPGGGPSGGLIEPFTPVDRTFPDGTRVRAVDGPDRATLDASFDFASADEYQQKLRQVSQAVSSNPDAALSEDGSIEIRRLGDRLDVTLDIGPGLAGAGGFDVADLAGVLDPDALPEVVVTLAMPGSILATNGAAQGRTVRWDLLRRGAPTTLTATSRVAEPGLPAWAVPAGAALIVALLLGIGGVLLSQRRGTADDPGVHGPEPGTFFPPPPPGSLSPGAPGWPTPPSAPPTPAPTGPPPAPAWPEPPPDAAPPWRVPGPPVEQPVTTDLPTEQPMTVPPAEQPVAVPPAEQHGTVSPNPATAAALAVGSTPEPGWYADPAGGAGLRYWDGGGWTQHTT